MNITIWTDGSYNRHNNKCACAYVIKSDTGFYHEQSFKILEGKLSTNIAEMQGIIQALKFLHLCVDNKDMIESITVTSDSQYCIKGITEWVHKWRTECFQGRKNVAEWKDFYQLTYKSGFKNIQFKWVKGHTGVEENERCDLLCGVITSTKADKLRERL